MSAQLPYKQNASVPRRKLLDYLLSEKHLVGKAKAKFFRSLGFSETAVRKLEQGLLQIAQQGEVQYRVESPYGTKYIIDGLLHTPSGFDVNIRTIWVIERDQQVPRFVTAYPIEPERKA